MMYVGLFIFMAIECMQCEREFPYQILDFY